MRKTSLWCGSTLAALMIGTAGSAKADDHGFYADISAGTTLYPVDVDGQLNGVRFKHDGHTSDFTYAFAVGYRFNQYVGMEAGFVDFGNPYVDIQDPVDPKMKRGRARFSGQGKTLAVLAHLPTGDWDTFLRVGVLQAQLGSRYYIRNGTFGFDYFSMNEGPSLLLGVGTRYAFADRWAVGLSVDYYSRVGGEEWADLVSPRIGFSYRF
jgi:opacity protein-like surface antigen